MTVYRITDSSAAGSPRQVYASLCPVSARPRDFDEFQGKPCSRKWRPIKVYFDKPRLPRPDFFAYDSKVLVCNQRALDLVGEALEFAGELVPIKVEREKTTLYLLNVTECINVVDHKASQWQQLLPGRHLLQKPAFLPRRFGEHTSLFKIPEDFGLRIYCLERTGHPADGEFKALVKRHRLTGLRFEPIWTDRKPLPAARSSRHAPRPKK